MLLHLHPWGSFFSCSSYLQSCSCVSLRSFLPSSWKEMCNIPKRLFINLLQSDLVGVLFFLPSLSLFLLRVVSQKLPFAASLPLTLSLPLFSLPLLHLSPHLVLTLPPTSWHYQWTATWCTDSSFRKVQQHIAQKQRRQPNKNAFVRILHLFCTTTHPWHLV